MVQRAVPDNATNETEGTMTQTTRRSAASTTTLRDSVEHVWLAGLGALALTEEEGGRLFRTLVKRGEGVEKQTRTRLRRVVSAAREAPAEAMTKIETGLDDTMGGVLRRLGVPTRREITSLTRRVEALAETLDERPVRPARPRRTAGTRRKTSRSTATAGSATG